MNIFKNSQTAFIHDSADQPVTDRWEMIVSNKKIREELDFSSIYPAFLSALDARVI